MFFPLLWPKSGGYGDSGNISLSGICTSDHLNTSTPSLSSARKHSLNPSDSIFFQFSSRRPYFNIIHTAHRSGGDMERMRCFSKSSIASSPLRSHGIANACKCFRAVPRPVCREHSLVFLCVFPRVRTAWTPCSFRLNNICRFQRVKPAQP